MSLLLSLVLLHLFSLVCCLYCGMKHSLKSFSSFLPFNPLTPIKNSLNSNHDNLSSFTYYSSQISLPTGNTKSLSKLFITFS